MLKGHSDQVNYIEFERPKKTSSTKPSTGSAAAVSSKSPIVKKPLNKADNKAPPLPKPKLSSIEEEGKRRGGSKKNLLKEEDK